MDMIAVLDGLMANPNTDIGSNSGYVGRQTNPSGSGGANYSGGSNFYPGAPTTQSSEGLAGMEQGWMNDPTPSRLPADDYRSYLSAFSESPYVVSGGGSEFNENSGYVGRSVNVSGSGGANYSGGSSFYSSAPTMPSSEGLAGLERAFGRMGSVGAAWDPQAGYVGRSVNVSGSGGANYSGGSSFYPNAPTMPSSEGLARASLYGMLALGADPVRTVIGVNRAKPAFVVDTNNLCGAAYDACYKSAKMAGYDEYWCQMAGRRCAERCMAIGWDMYATKA